MVKGTHPAQGKKSYIKVLPKKDKDTTLPESYRSISLINIDAKILSQIVAKCLAEVLPTILHSAQQGFTKGRSAVSNIRKVLLVLEQIKQQPYIDKAIISLAAAKAFDNVNKHWILQVLTRMGFSRNITTLKDLYNSPTARICTPGALSPPITLQKGTRQGCPLSTVHFNLSLEPLSKTLASTTQLKCIKIGGEEVTSAMFADDILLFTASPQNDIPYIQQLFRTYQDFAGLKINFSKSKIIPSPVSTTAP